MIVVVVVVDRLKHETRRRLEQPDDRCIELSARVESSVIVVADRLVPLISRDRAIDDLSACWTCAAVQVESSLVETTGGDDSDAISERHETRRALDRPLRNRSGRGDDRRMPTLDDSQ